MSDTVSYYGRRDVQEAIIREVAKREIGIRYGDKGFGTRPQILTFEGDIMHLAKAGATSFHISEERWFDPLKLKSGLSRKELDELREGWDLILDIDTPYFQFAKFCAESLIEVLEFHDITGYGLKFSGRSGIHIGIPFEAFPQKVNDMEVRTLFPDGVRNVAGYMKKVIAKKLADDILSVNTEKELAESIGKKVEEIKPKGVFDPYTLVDLDAVAIASRHMIRAPYSVNEKSGLVSLPLTREKLKIFSLKMAKTEEVETKIRFIDPARVTKKEEAKSLLVEAFDWASKQMPTPLQEAEKKPEKTFEEYAEAVGENLFPPCIQSLLSGVQHDGRKRSVFILIQFLRNMAWPMDKIQDTLLEWNRKNYEPLPDGYIISQINWHKRQKEKLPPPNCKNEAYYLNLNVCSPNQWCENIKNPLQHVHKKMRAVKRDSPKGKKKKG